MEIIGIYNLPFRASIAHQADALFFVRKVSPLGPRGSGGSLDNLTDALLK